MSEIVKLYDKIYSHYRLMNSLMTLGLDKYWRRKTVEYIRLLNSNPLSICDICCGTGDFTEFLVSKFPGAVVTGVDANENMIKIAEEKNIKANFLNSYISNLPFDNESFDLVTVSFATRNIFFASDFDKSLNEIKRVLKKGGFFVSVETSMPANFLFKFLIKIYLETVLTAIKIFLPGSYKSYSFLKSSIYSFKAEKFNEKLSLHFDAVYMKNLFPGSVAICAAKK
ncbi:MAG TPA: ubiquinone/menaquinone biosynthesis methyltransferase [Elusimicrobiales bacterium]|nr:ubiquinone/menaquinone biosynthesis methyltransferase [Elusimicrobiales bacterium]HOL61997.1 ubiquinone/menaquinone biosynthesis methyltransferase [Elusimicrobiales bacterium]HPO94501.1 ubiquinone/menaquinone biosynthesis methyltransferase [Elusimicrobiales bacterium]